MAERMRNRLSLLPVGGFTLLELLISLAIIGIIAGLVAAAMRLGFRSVDAGEKKIESLERKRASLMIIESQIQSQLPLSYNEDGAQKYAFKGERDSMEFPTNHSIWGGQTGYVSVTYTIDTDRTGKKMLSASEALIGREGGGEVRLLEGYDDLSFEFYSKDPTEEKGEWVDRWNKEDRLPTKVRLRMARGLTDLSLIIPMRAQGIQSLLPGGGTRATQGQTLQDLLAPRRGSSNK